LPDSTPASFFLDLFDRTFELDNEDQAQEILKLIEARYSQDKEARLDLALRLMDLDQDNQAIAMMRQLVQEYPTYLEAQMHLGGLYYHIGQTHLAKRHWNKAETQARKANDQAFLAELEFFKDQLIHGPSLPGELFEILRDMPPEMLESFLEETNAPPDIIDLIRNMGMGSGKKKL
jgi:tetratricopeptide (TPR) repeat protein